MRVLYLFVILIFAGCGIVNTNQAVSGVKIEQKNVIDIIDDDEKYQLSQDNEIYFASTRGKVLYGKDISRNSVLEYKITILLNKLLYSKNLPRKSRRKKIYIALEVTQNSKNKEKILEIAQNIILSKKRFGLSNLDSKSLKVLKKVLKKEKDSIYKKRFNIHKKSTSDVILYISLINNSLSGKLLKKNGEIIASYSTKLNNKANKGWVDVEVLRNDGVAQVFEVMVSPVTAFQYSGVGGDLSVTGVSFLQANTFCKNKFHANLLHPYVFEYARRGLLIKKPKGAYLEMMAPYDEEEHEIYYQEGDKLESGDGDIVIFHWDNERYFSVSNMFDSNRVTFRCMRRK